jgi:sugar-specific transcriptional regulator TrmB
MNIDDQQITELLKNFSFSEEEGSLYIAALSLNRPTIAQLARAAGISRTSAYFHAKKLLDKGFLKEIKGNKVAQYEAKSPDQLASLFERFTLDFKSMVPALAALRKTEAEKPLIEVFDSKKGYYEIYNEISALPHSAYFMVVEGGQAVRNEMTLLDNTQWEKFFERIVERKIMTKALFTDEVISIPNNHLSKSALKLIGQRVWNIHTLPEDKFPLKDLFFIYGNRVAILFPKEKLVIKIQHDAIAALFKVMFNTLYEFGKPIANPWVKEG